MEKILAKINSASAYPLIALIWVYQKTISPDHGLLKILYPNGYCKFYPSCSEYSRQTLIKYGIFPGIIKSFKRVVSCTPSSLGGVDLP